MLNIKKPITWIGDFVELYAKESFVLSRSAHTNNQYEFRIFTTNFLFLYFLNMRWMRYLKWIFIILIFYLNRFIFVIFFCSIYNDWKLTICFILDFRLGSTPNPVALTASPTSWFHYHKSETMPISQICYIRWKKKSLSKNVLD